MADRVPPSQDDIQTTSAVIGFAVRDIVRECRIHRQEAVQAQIDHDRAAVSRGSDILLSIFNSVADDIIDLESDDDAAEISLIEASRAMTAQPQPAMVQDTIERPTAGTVQMIPQHDSPLAQPLLEPSGPSGGKRSFSKISTTAMAVSSGENISGPHSRPVKSAPVTSSRATSYPSSDAQSSLHLTALRRELGRPQNDPPFIEWQLRRVSESLEPYEDDDAEPKPAPKKRKKVHTSPYIVTSASPSPELSPLHTDAVAGGTDSHSRDVSGSLETEVKVKRVGSASKDKIETSQKRSSVRSKTPSKPDWHTEVFTPLEQEKQKAHGMLSDHNIVKERSRAAERKRAEQEKAEKRRALEEQNEERDD